MPFLPDNYKLLQSELEEKKVNLVAVSKTKPIEEILHAYEHGIMDFGENYVQELVSKYEQLPKNIRWHFIGHLQSNKVKYIADFVYLIHGVDSVKLLSEINKQAEKTGRIINCLLQVHIAEEETKFGFDAAEISNVNHAYFKHLNIRGLMGMATYTDDVEKITREFRKLKAIFDLLKQEKTNFDILSMGMSADYKLAINEGSNMIRAGSLLFGDRF